MSNNFLFRQLFDSTSSTYTYLLASGYGRDAVIIDPVLEQMPLYLKLLQELGLKLVVSIDTHVHADHITAAGKLSEATQCSMVMGENSKAECLSYKMREGESLNIDGTKLTALYTPGHTDDSYSFLMNDRVFTGDTLLIRGTGRTDFQNGSAEAAYDSLFNKLLTLSDDTLIYPGHDYKGMMVSTIREEKQFNPRLQVKSKAEYIALMANLNLPKPKLIDIAVPANLRCGL